MQKTLGHKQLLYKDSKEKTYECSECKTQITVEMIK